jgi:hypothetical protein
MADEVDPLDEFMKSIDAEVASLGTMRKDINSLPITRHEEEAEEGASEEDEPIDSEMLKNLSVEEMLA